MPQGPLGTKILLLGTSSAPSDIHAPPPSNLFTNHHIQPHQKTIILAHFAVFNGPVHHTNGS